MKACQMGSELSGSMTPRMPSKFILCKHVHAPTSVAPSMQDYPRILRACKGSLETYALRQSSQTLGPIGTGKDTFCMIEENCMLNLQIHISHPEL